MRAFAAERFHVWRCGQCGSIHARDEVDLSRYYENYPFHHTPEDWRSRAVYNNQLRRLKRAGLRPHHSILDYGCGGGGFVRHLRRCGYRNADGFDAYSEAFGDRAALQRKYDCVFAQDVIEHVSSPHALLDEFEKLSAPGGMIAIGTPNAAAIDLMEPERTVHALHLPYHRHILSKSALLDTGRLRGWQLERYYATEYANTLVPYLNAPFMSYYMRVLDNSIDCLFEAPKMTPFVLRLPLTLFWGWFGYFFAPETDVMAIFRKPVLTLPLQASEPRISGSP